MLSRAVLFALLSVAAFALATLLRLPALFPADNLSPDLSLWSVLSSARLALHLAASGLMLTAVVVAFRPMGAMKVKAFPVAAAASLGLALGLMLLTLAPMEVRYFVPVSGLSLAVAGAALFVFSLRAYADRARYEGTGSLAWGLFEIDAYRAGLFTWIGAGVLFQFGVGEGAGSFSMGLRIAGAVAFLIVALIQYGFNQVAGYKALVLITGLIFISPVLKYKFGMGASFDAVTVLVQLVGAAYVAWTLRACRRLIESERPAAAPQERPKMERVVSAV